MQNEDGCFNFLGWQIVCVPGNLFTKKNKKIRNEIQNRHFQNYDKQMKVQFWVVPVDGMIVRTGISFLILVSPIPKEKERLVIGVHMCIPPHTATRRSTLI